MNKKQKRMLLRIITASLMMIALVFVPADGILRFLLYLIPYLVIGYDILWDAVRGILNRRLFDENFLMAAATVGAMAIGLSRSGDYVEAIAVMLFYQIGELFQSYAVGKSRRNISELMDIRPDSANIELGGEIVTADPDEVAVGSVIVVRPGEKVPIDGVVVEGSSSLNTTALTGESVPRDVTEGDDIVSGCVNMTGLLRIRTTKEFGESTVSKILDLVENASSRKSRSENFITKFARVYTPAVCCGAMALAIIPPLVRMFALGLHPDWSEWIYRALTFLVISCPCALVISIPLSFFAGIGGAGKEGILVKGSNYLEALSQTDCVVFDKTGTLTRGTFEVTSVEPASDDIAPEKLLEYAAYAESASTHPISRSIIRTYENETGIFVSSDAHSRVSGIREIGGRGICAVIDGIAVSAGNTALMQSEGIKIENASAQGTEVHVSADGKYYGRIVISDTLKPGAKDAIRSLKSTGVKSTVMLTGDNHTAAKSAAEEVGIDVFYSELMPGDKVEKVENLLQSRGSRGKLAFVGDGINDAPVLSRADIGIAMGAMGSDAAIEAADVVLMDDDPRKVAKAIAISRKCMSIVYQNIVFALGVKALCLILGAFGIANMWLAIFADVGVMVLAVLNAIRALFVSKE